MKNMYYLAALVFLLTACEKTDDDNDSSGSSSKVKTSTISVTGAGTLTEEFYYDDEGRIDEVLRSDGSRLVFDYSGTSIFQWEYDASQFLEVTYEFLPGSGAYTDSSIVDRDGFIHYEGYSYNADGRMTSFRYYDEDGTLESEVIYTYTGPNYTSVVVRDDLGDIVFTNTYEYDLDHVTSIAYENFGRFYMGKGVVNVVKAYSTTIPGNPTQSRFNTVVYDSKNRVSSLTSKDPSGNITQTENYTYY